MTWTNKEFIIDNIKSRDIDVKDFVLIRNDAQIERQIMGNKEIKSESIPYNDLPTFFRTNKSVIEFDILISFIDADFTSDRLQYLGYIFGKDKYVPFQSIDYLDVQYYVMAKSISLVTFGDYKGWVHIHLETNAPYSWSIPQINNYDLSHIDAPKIVQIYNKSNVTNAYGENYYYPEVYIDLKGSSTGLIIKNISDSGRETVLTGLNLNESIIINRYNLRQVESSSGIPRLSNFNKNFLRLIYGKNLLQINNKCQIQIKSQFPIYT
jgi:hypothetical protein